MTLRTMYMFFESLCKFISLWAQLKKRNLNFITSDLLNVIPRREKGTLRTENILKNQRKEKNVARRNLCLKSENMQTYRSEKSYGSIYIGFLRRVDGAWIIDARECTRGCSKCHQTASNATGFLGWKNFINCVMEINSKIAGQRESIIVGSQINWTVHVAKRPPHKSLISVILGY